MHTSEVSIQFNSHDDLREFIGTIIKTQFYEVSYSKFTVKCHCTEEDLDLAVEKYQAKIVNVN